MGHAPYAAVQALYAETNVSKEYFGTQHSSALNVKWLKKCNLNMLLYAIFIYHFAA